jgi:hypothetical protein
VKAHVPTISSRLVLRFGCSTCQEKFSVTVHARFKTSDFISSDVSISVGVGFQLRFLALDRPFDRSFHNPVQFSQVSRGGSFRFELIHVRATAADRASVNT